MKSKSIPSADSADYYRGFHDGFMAAKKQPTTVVPTVPFPVNQGSMNCYVCGIKHENAMHYVCTNWNCPTKVTVTSQMNTTISNNTLNGISDNNMSMLNANMVGAIKSEDLK